MTLTDPREALADQSNFIGYLVGLAGVARMVHTLADDDRRSDTCHGPDDFVHVLLGLASLGAAIEPVFDIGAKALRCCALDAGAKIRQRTIG